jgi:hypothetical protein
MAFARAHAHDFSQSGDFEPLRDGFLCFNAFGPSHSAFPLFKEGVFIGQGRGAGKRYF